MTKVASTHESLRFMLKFARWFGLLPVLGVNQDDCTDLRFEWSSKRTLYSIMFLMMTILNTLFQVLRMIRHGIIEFGQTVTLLFFSVTIVIVTIFIDVARKWPRLMVKWGDVDVAMSSLYGFPPSLHRKLKIVAGVVMTAALLEHSLFLAFMFKHSEKADNFSETVRLYFEHSFDQVFHVIPYNIVVGVVFQIFNTFSTVAWNFMDLFVMLVSMCLAARFKQVMMRLSTLTKTKESSEDTWRELREDYTRLTSLARIVDDTISTIILISFGNNIYVVLVQLYFSLQRPPSNGILDKIYYIYSFSFLILRTSAVALYAATINSESKKTVSYLSTASHNVYNIEIERLLYQTKFETVTLSGHHLFKVTRSLILSVAGAIVSYELVLIQFNVA